MMNNSDEEKVPTAVHFEKGPNGKKTWGYEIPYDKTAIKWFKLMLLDEEDLKPDTVKNCTLLAKSRQGLHDQKKTTIEVISIYLRELWKHSLDVIGTAIGRPLLNSSKLSVVITLPAIWPDYARGRMIEAARLAGILDRRTAGDTNLSFVGEPEAAAFATLHDMSGRHDIKVRLMHSFLRFYANCLTLIAGY